MAEILEKVLVEVMKAVGKGAAKNHCLDGSSDRKEIR